MTPWQILSIPIGASDSEIKLAYRSLARKHHPDLGGDVAMMQAINNAYDALVNGARFQPQRVQVPKKPLSDIMKIADGLIEIQVESKYKRGWVPYAFTTATKAVNVTLDDWEYLARRLGYKPSWASIKFKQTIKK
jgi:DnaJ domain